MLCFVTDKNAHCSFQGCANKVWSASKSVSKPEKSDFLLPCVSIHQHLEEQHATMHLILADSTVN